MWAWERKKGCHTAAWYHRIISSASGLPKKPPTSAPQKVMPAKLRDRHIGIEACKGNQIIKLSNKYISFYLVLVVEELLIVFSSNENLETKLMGIYRLRKNRYLKLSKRKLAFFKKTLHPPISFSSKVFHNKHDWNGSTRIRHVICQAVVFTQDVYHWLLYLLLIKWTRVMLQYRLMIV